MYAYCLNNPVCKVDYFGNKPGDLFDTMDDAAEDFAKYINEKSISNNLEYSTYIYTIRVAKIVFHRIILPKWIAEILGVSRITVAEIRYEEKYTYRNPTRGGVDSAGLTVNGLIGSVGIAHAHGAYDDRYDSDQFSPGDRDAADFFNYPIYVATPVGILWKYDPATGLDSVVAVDIPYDENHPYRKD